MAALDAELLEVLVVDSLAFLGRLDAAGAPRHAVHVNINASDLRDRAMADTVLGAIHDVRVSPERLVLELTEREILHVDHVERLALARLDAAGVHLAVDDFGTGYSSLAHLLDFPADHVKIDRRFIDHLPDDADSLALVRGVVSMAHGLGLTTVAEGVETEAAARTVEVIGCDQLQGFLFAPALAPDTAIAWWQTHAMTSTRSRSLVTPPG
jgi:EAL domain-containing protein (putative c-di-GMP-specific phosphodiesterase class I)